AADVADLERRLPRLQGSERARVLADLTDACKSDNAKKAVAYGEEALALHPDPATEVRTRNELGWAYMTLGDNDRAEKTIEAGRAIAEANHDEAGLARALNNLGVIARARGNFARAVELFNASLEHYRRTADRKAIAMGYNNLGFVYGTDLSDYEAGIRYHLEALRVREAMGDREGVALSLNNIGIIYSRLGDYDRAFANLLRALELRRQIGAKNRIAATLSNLGEIELSRGQTQRAMTYHQEALALRRDIGEKSGIAVSLRTLGDLHLALDEVDQAAPLLEEGLALATAIGDKGLRARALLSMSALERKRGHASAARRDAEEALAMSTTMKARDVTRRAYEELSASYEAEKNYGAALDAFRKMKQENDELLAEGRQKQIASLEVRYQKERREREIEALRHADATTKLQLAQRRFERNAAVALIVVVMVIGFLLVRRRSEIARINAELSVTDALTGLKNRRYLTQTIEADVAVALRRQTEGNDLVFLLVDVDHFKSVNDQRGHAAGDRFLQEFARVLRQTSRSSDVVVRWGGEEFLVIARFTDRVGAVHHAEAIRKTIEETSFTVDGGPPLQRTCSIGFAAFPFVPSAPTLLTWSQVLRFADDALYIAKRTRNTWVGLRAATNGESFAERDTETLIAAGAVIVESSERGAVAAAL
ncbi:MAG: GGDEF domain-containing protein, partial [Acidobacteria bacterium]|nr:GGDEF domain-containing protein [Acidobacteriota bacterium]